MKSTCKKFLILLTVCVLPTVAIAADNSTGDQKIAPRAQPVPQATTETVQKAPAPPLPQSAPQSDAASVTPQSGSVAPIMVSDTFKPQPAILIGYVDLVRIGTESEPGKAGQDKLTERKKKLQTQIEAKRNQLDKQRAAIEAKLPTLTPAQRESKAKEFKKKVDEYQKFVQKADNELQELQQELSRTLIEKIEKAASEYGKGNNLALVTVKRELLYLAGNVVPQDITENVIKLVNENKQKK